MDKREQGGNSLNCPSQQRTLQPEGEGKVQINYHVYGVS